MAAVVPRPEKIGTTTFPGATSILARWWMAGGKRDKREQQTRRSHDKGEEPHPLLGHSAKVRLPALPMDYVDVPSVARRLPPEDARPTQPQPRIQSPVKPAYSSPSPTELTNPVPAKTMLGNLPAMLLASTAGIPTSGSFSGQRGSGTLISTRDPLSIPTTTANFRRFVSKVGPIFWLQDRIEEILMWKRGWKVTAVWMAVYTFLCEFLFSRQVWFSGRIHTRANP